MLTFKKEGLWKNCHEGYIKNYINVYFKGFEKQVNNGSWC